MQVFYLTAEYDMGPGSEMLSSRVPPDQSHDMQFRTNDLYFYSLLWFIGSQSL